MNQQFSSKPQGSEAWDVAIIGSGPAGLTAAIYTTRGAASTLLFAGASWGGQLMLTTTVDNFPGFSQGIEGPELMQAMRSQAERFGTKIIEKNVTSVDFHQTPFHLTTDENTFIAKSVIIATGSITRWLGIPGEDSLRGRGVSSCAPCDAPFFKDKKVVVIGGGDSAMEEALVLTKYATSVTIIHRRDEFRASAAMQKRVSQNPKIKTLINTEALEFQGQNKLEAVLLKNNQTGQTTTFPTDGAFIAIGHTPSTDIFQDQLELDEKGYVKRQETDHYQMATSVPGIFVAGDVHDIRYKQAITAAAFGCMAALDALKYLDKALTS
jgi:thioredoxin reductase (NADPH)